jgi:hypothetical protein
MLDFVVLILLIQLLLRLDAVRVLVNDFFQGEADRRGVESLLCRGGVAIDGKSDVVSGVVILVLEGALVAPSLLPFRTSATAQCMASVPSDS